MLSRVRCPYLYIDCGQPHLDLDLLRELCPQVVIGKTVGAGHKALQDVPDQINAMLNRFIQPCRRNRRRDDPYRGSLPVQLPLIWWLVAGGWWLVAGGLWLVDLTATPRNPETS